LATIQQAYRDLWGAVKSTVPFNPETGICKEWMNRYQEWGSPLGLEKSLDGEEDGAVFQVFAHAIVKWTPSRGVEVVTGG
jgi:hypothetical protein